MPDVLRSLADPAALAAIIRRDWGIPVDDVVLYRSLVNDVYRVDPGHFLKVYQHGWRSHDDVLWECELTEHLVDHAIPVAPIVRRTDGAAAGTWQAPEGPRSLVLSTRVAGHTPRPPFAPALHREHGRLLARLHEAGEAFASGRGRREKDLATLLDEPLTHLLPRLEAPDRSMVARIAEAARSALTRLSPTVGLCHGDASLDNVLITGGTDEEPELTIFDFDLSGYGWTAEDFPYDVPNEPHFLAGYAEIRPIPAADLAAEPWIAAVRCIGHLNFHLVTKPLWRGLESVGEGWADAALADLRRFHATLDPV